MEQPRIKVPNSVQKGQPFEIKVIVSHPMESGQRKDEKSGEKIPRKILNDFVCTFDGKEILHVTMFPAVSANPYLSFFASVQHSGTMEFVWTDDDGAKTSASAPIEVHE